MINYVSNERLETIRLVMQIRVRLSQRAKDLLSAIQEKHPKIEINKKIIDFCAELGDISGFCDKNTNRWIDDVTRYMSGCIIIEEGVDFDLMSDLLMALLPRIVGMQIDFTKGPPFKAIGFNIEASLKDLKAKIGAHLNR